MHRTGVPGQLYPTSWIKLVLGCERKWIFKVTLSTFCLCFQWVDVSFGLFLTKFWIKLCIGFYDKNPLKVNKGQIRMKSVATQHFKFLQHLVATDSADL